MPIFIGDLQIPDGGILLDGTPIASVYIGDLLIYPVGVPLDDDRATESGDPRVTEFNSQRVLEAFTIVPRVSESGDPRVTEFDDPRVLE